MVADVNHAVFGMLWAVHRHLAAVDFEERPPTAEVK